MLSLRLIKRFLDKTDQGGNLITHIRLMSLDMANIYV